MSFSDFSKVETVKSLNDFLADKSYIEGYVYFLLDWCQLTFKEQMIEIASF